MRKFTLLALLIPIVLSGCATQRSVSSSGYYPGGNNGRGGDNPLYKGELSEFDVLGIDPGKEITEQDISRGCKRQEGTTQFAKRRTSFAYSVRGHDP